MTVLSPRQFISTAGKVAHAHGFVRVKEVPTDWQSVYGEGDASVQRAQLSSSERLHTAQQHFFRPGVQHYIDHPPEPHQWRDDSGYNVPEVRRQGGKMYVDEGHHRILASRLRGEGSITVALNDVDAR